MCCIVDNELQKTQRVCEAVGPGTISSELWAAAAAFNDAVTEYHRLQTQLSAVAWTDLHTAAYDAGLSNVRADLRGLKT